ncbi:MFS transporter [Nocardiopsis trehalosi]|jgi:MFS family permease|uniref:MFS transporter n=1 Tax=Nocardiopsis trehalosi TaxID=109329 RepID=UPI0008304D30|nr:MFS transporter [Nocardiopsis trehalosi]
MAADGTPERPDRRTWLWLLLVSVVATQTALNLARPLVSYRSIALGGDAVAIGLITAAYAVLPVLIAVPIGRLTDRSRRTAWLLAVGAGALAVSSLALARADGLYAIAAAGAGLGVGHLVCMLAGQGLIARLSPDSSLDRDFGWFSAAASLGQLIGPVLSGALLGDATGSALLGPTSVALTVAGVVAAAGLVPLVGLARSAPAPRPRPSGEDGDGDAAPAERPSTVSLLRRPGMPSGLLASLSLLASIDVLTAYLPLVAESRGIAPAVVGVLLGVRAATSLVSRLMLSWLLKRWSRGTLIIASTSGAGVALAVVALPIDEPLVLGAVLAAGGFLLGLGQPLTMTMVVTAVPATARGTALALRLWGNRIGQAAIPAAAGAVAGLAGTSGALWFSSAVLLASAAFARR